MPRQTTTYLPHAAAAEEAGRWSLARRKAVSLLRVNLIVVVPVTLLLFAVAPVQSPERFLRIAGLVTLVTNLNFVLLASFYEMVWRRLPLRSLASYVVLGVLLLPLVAALSSAISIAIFKRFGRVDLRTMATLLAVNMILVIFYGLGIYILREYRTRLAGVSANLEKEQQEHVETGLELDEMKLFALQVFLKPHFLFNSLNAIASLIHEDQEKAEEMTLGLARVLRKILEIRGRSVIPLEQEMAIVRDYMTIEKIRLGDKLTFTVDIPPEVLPTAVPAMVLQPLAENAIQHGIRQRKEAGHVHICARRINGLCLVEVKDNGPGVSSHSGMGQAMRLLHDRLEKLYGAGNYELTLQRDPRTQETIASLSVPLRDGALDA